MYLYASLFDNNCLSIRMLDMYYAILQYVCGDRYSHINLFICIVVGVKVSHINKLTCT